MLRVFKKYHSFKINLKVVAGSSEGKESACNAGDLGLTPGLGRSPGGGYSLEGDPLEGVLLPGEFQLTKVFQGLDLLEVQGTLKSVFQYHSSKASILQLSAFFIVQLSHPYMTTGTTIAFQHTV